MKKMTAALTAVLFACCSVSCTKKLAVQKLTVKKANGTTVTVAAEMARTPAEREHGFMERKNIPGGTGMLFLFPADQILSFWMKNTPTPLSIAYIDSSGKIRDEFDMTPFSLANITSTVRVRYALEVPQGWFAKNGIAPGDTVVVDFDTRCN